MITDVLSSPDSDFYRRIFPGEAARVVLEVLTAQMTVLMAERLKESAWMTKTGLCLPGSDPRGEGNFAHHISPLIITIHPLI